MKKIKSRFANSGGSRRAWNEFGKFLWKFKEIGSVRCRGSVAGARIQARQVHPKRRLVHIGLPNPIRTAAVWRATCHRHHKQGNLESIILFRAVSLELYLICLSVDILSIEVSSKYRPPIRLRFLRTSWIPLRSWTEFPLHFRLAKIAFTENTTRNAIISFWSFAKFKILFRTDFYGFPRSWPNSIQWNYARTISVTAKTCAVQSSGGIGTC